MKIDSTICGLDESYGHCRSALRALDGSVMSGPFGLWGAYSLACDRRSVLDNIDGCPSCEGER
jgi:hypothetical protein